MKIAILVWGSLYWGPRGLQTTGQWYLDGPELPIEFARISSGGRLTLVIKPKFDVVTTLYAISPSDNLAVARENSRDREGTEDLDNIGFIDFTNNTKQVRPLFEFVITILREWNIDKGFDAIIWSDFAPNFKHKTGFDFTQEQILQYLAELPEDQQVTALEYIRNTPPQITTRFRKAIEAYFKEKP